MLIDVGVGGCVGGVSTAGGWWGVVVCGEGRRVDMTRVLGRRLSHMEEERKVKEEAIICGGMKLLWRVGGWVR